MSCNSWLVCDCESDGIKLVSTAAGVVTLISRQSDVLTLDQAKDELNIYDTGDTDIDAATDARVTSAIAAAQDDCEKTVYKTYGSGTVRKVEFTGWPAVGILFDNPPLASVDSVEYIDADNVTQTLDPGQYVVYLPENKRGYLLWVSDFEGPELSDTAITKVIVTYTSGGPVPPVVEQASRMLLSRFYDNDKSPVELQEYERAAHSLLDGERWGDYA